MALNVGPDGKISAPSTIASKAPNVDLSAGGPAAEAAKAALTPVETAKAPEPVQAAPATKDPAPAAAVTEETPKVEDKPASKSSKHLAEMAERQRLAKAEAAVQKREAALADQQKQLDEERARYKAAAKDPDALLALGGWDYDKMIAHKINPGAEIKEVKDQFTEAQQAAQQQVEALRNELTNLTNQQAKEKVEAFKHAVTQKVSDPAAYPLINGLGRQAEVYQMIERHYLTTKAAGEAEVLTPAKAAELYEARITTDIKKLAGVGKTNAKVRDMILAEMGYAPPAEKANPNKAPAPRAAIDNKVAASPTAPVKVTLPKSMTNRAAREAYLAEIAAKRSGS